MGRTGRALAGAACALAIAAAPARAQTDEELRPVEAGQGVAPTQYGVVASPDARHVYAATPFFVLAFRREADGKLDFLGSAPVATTRQLAISPDGAHVLASASAGTVSVFARDAETGVLDFVEDEGAQLGDSAADLEVSRDGARVYVASPAHHALVVYARDAATGQLAFAQKLVDGAGGALGLRSAEYLAVSPDDRHVYVSGLFEVDPGPPRVFVDAIATYVRQPDDTLAFASLIRDGVGGTVGFDGAGAMAVTPDGAELLALDPATVGIVRFARDADTGALAFVDEYAPADDGGPGVLAPFWLALRGDGTRVYLGGLLEPDAGVVALARGEDGTLSYLAQAAGAGFDGAVGGRWIYTTGAPGVRVFAPEADAGAAGLAAAAALALSRWARPRRRRARASAPA